MRPLIFLFLVTMAALVAGCRSRPIPIVLRPGMTVDEAKLACRAAGVTVSGATAMGPISQYSESYELSDGRRMNLVTDHTKSPPIVLSGEITP